MQHSVVCPNIGHSIVHHFGEGAAVWGQAITPSIAHLVQGHRELAIDYAQIRPGIVFETVPSIAMLPHVIDISTFRIHVDTAVFRHTAGRSGAAIEAILRCDAGAECSLKLWGRVVVEDGASLPDQLSRADRSSTLPVLFTVAFWEISRASDARMRSMARVSAEKDGRIQELEMKLALTMCSQ
ncbi:hypothetical protein FHS25_006809 [Rhizobium laguerreae]|uniref:Uncharacterized protein n=1 Tax=Rhizobium laguerreae TaxID=1076926 RepID=A0ABR6GLR9_9HYPH|nr:hypothetical protein [Rhizobium laguerreae]MBB3166292.1 hypothetical protein [Rhizobium laguerreae]NKM21039.1 hypothetical protein [Rhizobium laguerreae]OOO42847.1 hypothetical protein BS630_30165 [Rhizobium laguerreae]